MTFACKQFSIKHDIAPLKVTTEALILGAYVANFSNKAKTILDIGTGTGLLPLMIGQKSDAIIDAVEIEKLAFELATENIFNSTFGSKIYLHHIAIQSYNPKIKYNLIVSNPPFFNNHLKAEASVRNIAIHNDLLPFDQLAASINRLLSTSGKFFILLPPYQLGLLESELLRFEIKKTAEFKIHHNETSKVLRIIATFGYNCNEITFVNFYIKDENNNYTQQFINLLKDYYLNF